MYKWISLSHQNKLYNIFKINIFCPCHYSRCIIWLQKPLVGLQFIIFEHEAFKYHSFHYSIHIWFIIYTNFYQIEVILQTFAQAVINVYKLLFCLTILNSQEFPNSNNRPLNSHGFTVSHTVSLPFSQSHSSFLISHSFTKFEWIF